MGDEEQDEPTPINIRWLCPDVGLAMRYTEERVSFWKRRRLFKAVWAAMNQAMDEVEDVDGG